MYHANRVSWLVALHDKKIDFVWAPRLPSCAPMWAQKVKSPKSWEPPKMCEPRRSDCKADTQAY